MELGNRNVLILMTALERTTGIIQRVTDAIARVLINDGPVTRELWWSLANDPTFHHFEPLRRIVGPDSTHVNAQFTNGRTILAG
jgi:hypothetical protein